MNTPPRSTAEPKIEYRDEWANGRDSSFVVTANELTRRSLADPIAPGRGLVAGCGLIVLFWVAVGLAWWLA